MIESLCYFLVEYDYLFGILSLLTGVLWIKLNKGNDGVIDGTFIIPLLLILFIIIGGAVPIHFTPAYKQGYNEYPNDSMYSYIITTNPNTWDVYTSCYIKGWMAADFHNNPWSFVNSNNIALPDLNDSYVHTHFNKTLN